jgi:hypothetical protein
MRLVWMFLAACSAPAANEALPAGPPPSPRACRDADLVATMQNEAAAANTKKVNDAVATYETAHALTQVTDPLRAIDPRSGSAEAVTIDRAVANQPGDHVIAVSGAVALVHVATIDPCTSPGLDVEYHAAHDASGAITVIRVDLARRVTKHVEQCGVCYSGCGMPEALLPWIAWILPAGATKDTPIADVPVTLDELDVTCERTMPAE